MYRFLLWCTAFLALGIVMGGCGDSGSSTPAGFAVSSTSPQTGQTEVLVTASVTATFNGTVDCTTVNAQTFAVTDALSTAVTGSYSCSGATATFKPTQLFSLSTLYSAMVTTAVRNSSGEALASARTWTFRTKKGIVAVKSGDGFTMARDSEGKVFAWGTNSSILGNRVQGTETTPLKVSEASMTAMGAGEGHAFMTTTAGAVYGWGLNGFGQVGTGVKSDWVSDPTVITGITGTVKDIVGSGRHTLALTQDGSVWAWGENCSGQLGDGTITDRPSPIKVQLPTGTVITAIDAADDTDAPCDRFSMALDSVGNVWVWGTNAHHQLAKPNSNDDPIGPDESLIPTKITGLSNVTAISAGWRFVTAVKNDDSVWAWGDGATGALGDGTCAVGHFSISPKQVANLANVTRISATRFGFQYTLVLKSDGTVWGWGDNHLGQRGDNSTGSDNACVGMASPMRGRMTPVQATGLSDTTDNRIKVIDVRAGAYHSVAVKNDGTVWAWGYNEEGLLGMGVSSQETVLTPTKVPIQGM